MERTETDSENSRRIVDGHFPGTRHPATAEVLQKLLARLRREPRQEDHTRGMARVPQRPGDAAATPSQTRPADAVGADQPPTTYRSEPVFNHSEGRLVATSLDHFRLMYSSSCIAFGRISSATHPHERLLRAIQFSNLTSVLTCCTVIN